MRIGIPKKLNGMMRIMAAGLPAKLTSTHEPMAPRDARRAPRFIARSQFR